MEKNGSSFLEIPHLTPRRIIAGTLVVVGVILAFVLLFRLQLVVFSLFEAIVFSTAISPLVDWLQKQGLSRPLSVAVVYLMILAIIVGIVFLVVPIFAEQGSTILYTLSTYYIDLRKAMLESPSILLQRLASRLPGAILLSETPVVIGAEPLDQFTQAIGYANSVLRGLFTTIAVLLLTSYWILERDRVVLSLIRLVPSEQRDRVRDLMAETGQRVGAYLRGLAILSLVVGVFAALAYIVIGLPYALLLGILAGIMEAIPLIGPLLGAIPALLVAIAFEPSKIIWVIVATVVIQVAENNLLVPRVMDRTVGVNPVVSLLAFAAFSSLFGLAGALLAIPLAVVIQLLLNHLVLAPSSLSMPPPSGRDSVSMLRLQAQELILDVRKHVREKEGVVDGVSDQVEDAIETIVNDLDSILAQAETNSEDSR